MFSFLKKIKKATLLVAFLFSNSIFAEVINKTETYKDIIEKSYNLSLQKDRGQAISILVNACKKESKKGLHLSELTTAIEDVAKIFYSEKAQQQFELAMSIKNSDLKAFTNKLNEVEKLEGDNVLLILEIIRNKIFQKSCSEALSIAKKLNEKTIYLDEVHLAYAQATNCNDKLVVSEKLIPFDIKKSPNRRYWLLLSIEIEFKKGLLDKAIEINEAAKKEFIDYPEFYYWTQKMTLKNKENPIKSSEKYVNLCKKLTVRQFREYSQDPYLCRRISEVENSIKKNNNQN